jgi:hypothetical protein
MASGDPHRLLCAVGARVQPMPQGEHQYGDTIFVSAPARAGYVDGYPESLQWQSAPSQSPWLLDRQGWSTLLAGALLLLISFLANYGDDHLLQFGSLPASDQIGMGLHLAALAALAGDAQLATRLRHRTANEAARSREQASRRARIQAGFLIAQCRFLLADTTRNRLQLSEALAVLLEEIRLQKS